MLVLHIMILAMTSISLLLNIVHVMDKKFYTSYFDFLTLFAAEDTSV